MVTHAGAAPGDPQLKLIRAKSEVTLGAYGRRVQLDLGVFVAAIGAPFELQVTRPVYSEPLVLKQILRGPGDGTTIRPLDSSLVDGWGGLSKFLEIEIKNKAGEVIRRRKQTFCPNAYQRERLNDDGPRTSGYPEGCGYNPFTRGMIWGIDEGWAATPFGWDSPGVRLDPGRYSATVTIAEAYREVFGIAPQDATTQVAMKVEKREYDHCRRCQVAGRSGTMEEEALASQGVPDMADPDPSLLPDLMSLPAWGMSVNNRRNGKSFLAFGATVWTGGASPLVVEGFRQENTDIMDAYQYFYKDGEPQGRTSVGALEYDSKRGHEHWHFLQFAKYSLTTAEQTEIVKSKKEAFCLAPTDAIDLTLPGAEIRPGSIGFGTACGSPTSLWVREILPLGWGDTYHQGIPGQSFNITNLPNGRYHIAVEANPGGLLHEQDKTNNVEYREIFLRGRPGSRRVEVPAWNGIDSEGGYHKGFRP
jgi:hypothetical protein